MDYNLTFLIITFTVVVSFFYYTKCKEYEREFLILHKKYDRAIIENDNYKLRIKDLQKYKNDVSKTFKILDNELTHINNHVEKQVQLNRHMDANNVNLLTADMLSNLINNMNQESLFPSISNISSIHLTRTNTENLNNENSISQNTNELNEDNTNKDLEDNRETEPINENHSNSDMNNLNSNGNTTNLSTNSMLGNLNIGGLPNPYRRMRIFSSDT